MVGRSYLDFGGRIEGRAASEEWMGQAQLIGRDDGVEAGRELTGERRWLLVKVNWV